MNSTVLLCSQQVGHKDYEVITLSARGKDRDKKTGENSKRGFRKREGEKEEGEVKEMGLAGSWPGSNGNLE